MDGFGTRDGLTQRWEGIGSGSSVVLRAIAIWITELPVLGPVATAKGTHHSRPLVFVQVIGEADGNAVEGWGECAALGDASYDAEDVSGAVEALQSTLVPALFDQAGTDAHRLPPPSRLASVRRAAPAAPLAFAALEMAVADTHLRAEDRSLAGLLEVDRRWVDLGAVAGLFPSTDALVARVESLADAGFTRVKLKIGPGWDIDPLEAVSGLSPGFGCRPMPTAPTPRPTGAASSRSTDSASSASSSPSTARTSPPTPWLSARMSTPICLDESLGSPDQDVEAALAMGACSVVCVKPSRLGGLGAALKVIDLRVAASGVPLWMGGMFESGYARGVNTTLAALPGFAWPGDLSPPLLSRRRCGPRSGGSRSGPAGALAASPPRGTGNGDASRSRRSWLATPPPSADAGRVMTRAEPARCALHRPFLGRRRVTSPPCVQLPFHAFATTLERRLSDAHDRLVRARGPSWPFSTSSWWWSTRSPMTPGFGPWSPRPRWRPRSTTRPTDTLRSCLQNRAPWWNRSTSSNVDRTNCSTSLVVDPGLTIRSHCHAEDSPLTPLPGRPNPGRCPSWKDQRRP